MWREGSCRSTSALKLNATGIPTWCSAAIAGRHVLAAPDRVDARQQRGDRIGAIALDRRFIQATGPEIAQEFGHAALRRLHVGIEQVDLLLLRALRKLRERRLHARSRDRVGLEPVGIRLRIEVAADQAGDGRLLRRGFFLFRGVGRTRNQQRPGRRTRRGRGDADSASGSSVVDRLT